MTTQSSNDLASTTLTSPPSLREVAAKVSAILDGENIPNVLWGNLMLTIWGVPTIVNGVSFIIPDHVIATAYTALLHARFEACSNPLSCDESAETRCSPAPTVHVHTTQSISISLFKHSETLTNVAKLELPDEKERECADIILASSNKLPDSRLGRGDGRFPASLYPVRIPSSHRLFEAYINLTLKYRFHGHEFFFAAMLTYISEYVAGDGFLDVDCLDPLYKKLFHEYEVGEKPLPELLTEYFGKSGQLPGIDC